MLRQTFRREDTLRYDGNGAARFRRLFQAEGRRAVSRNRVAMLPPPPRHLTEAQIADLDKYLENLRAGSPADVDAVGPITEGQDAAHP